MAEAANQPGTEDVRKTARIRALVDEIEREFAMTADMTGLSGMTGPVRQAMESVPRDAFVPAGEREWAWYNQPLPIGHRQTISQPFIVALMTSLLEPEATDRILEIGTGSGYQAAILSGLVARIWSIELEPELARTAADRLRALDYANVEVKAGDGAAGWPEHAPFDGIIVTAGAPEIPAPLVDQLAEGGRLVIPVDTDYGQDLRVITKTPDGRTDARSVLPVAFVPLRRTAFGR